MIDPVGLGAVHGWSILPTGGRKETKSALARIGVYQARTGDCVCRLHLDEGPAGDLPVGQPCVRLVGLLQ